MKEAITLKLETPVMQALRAQAAAEGRTVEEVLAETIEATFTPLKRDPRAPQMAREVAAYEAQHAELVERYLGEYVAMQGGEVVDHDVDEDALFERLEKWRAKGVVLVRQVEETLPGPIVVTSFRLEPRDDEA